LQREFHLPQDVVWPGSTAMGGSFVVGSLPALVA